MDDDEDEYIDHDEDEDEWIDIYPDRLKQNAEPRRKRKKKRQKHDPKPRT